MTDDMKYIYLRNHPLMFSLTEQKLKEIAAIAKSRGILLCVDNTFASPALQKPILLGADLVVHSATKYLGGHSDLIAGAVITKEESLAEKIKFIQNASGSILGPFDSWLVIRGIETLPLRVKQHSTSAFEVARFLSECEEVEHIFYPGFSSHRNHEVARKQMKAFGGIVSFTLKEDTEKAAAAFVTSTKLFRLAESLGGIKSLLCHPATMTHKSIPAEKRRSSGVADSLIRLSVGLEDADDLMNDLKQAFKGTAKKAVLSTEKIW